jgi:predicted nucleotidyltransferase
LSIASLDHAIILKDSSVLEQHACSAHGKHDGMKSIRACVYSAELDMWGKSSISCWMQSRGLQILAARAIEAVVGFAVQVGDRWDANDRGRSEVTHSVFRDHDALAVICRRYHIRRLSLFGSTLKGSDRPDSDVDLLVEFEPDARPSLLTMARIEIELSPLLGGRKVDLRTAQDLSRYFREEVVRVAETQYEAR